MYVYIYTSTYTPDIPPSPQKNTHTHTHTHTHTRTNLKPNSCVQLSKDQDSDCDGAAHCALSAVQRRATPSRALDWLEGKSNKVQYLESPSTSILRTAELYIGPRKLVQVLVDWVLRPSGLESHKGGGGGGRGLGPWCGSRVSGLGFTVQGVFLCHPLFSPRIAWGGLGEILGRLLCGAVFIYGCSLWFS